MKFQIWCLAHDAVAAGNIPVFNDGDGYEILTEGLHCVEQYRQDGECGDFKVKIDGDQILMNDPPCRHPEYKEGKCAEMYCANYVNK
jgi:hypothetical protein